jgi:hypothetical protein
VLYVLPHFNKAGPVKRLSALGIFKPLNNRRIGLPVRAMINPSGSSGAVLKPC